MDRKMIALLGLMLVADMDAETVLLHLLRKRCQEMKSTRKSTKNRSYKSQYALSQAPNNSDSSEANSDSSEEEDESSDDIVSSEEEEDGQKLAPTEKVVIKSEPHDDFDLYDEENKNSTDLDEDLFDAHDLGTHSSEKVVIKEEPKDAEDSIMDIKIESEEMIIDDVASNKVLLESSGTNSDNKDVNSEHIDQNEDSFEDQNTKLGSLVTLSLKSLKHKQSREKLEKLIQKAIQDVIKEDTS